jgi:hypothetical protein
MREEAKKRSSVVADSQEKLLAVGASLTDALGELKDHPYSQELLKRSSDLTENLVGQGNRLSQVLVERSSGLVERGSKTTQAIADRGSEVLSDLAERSEKVSKEVARRSEKVSKEIARRSEKANREIARRSEKASKELAKRSEKVSRELAKRSQDVANVVAQRSREASARLPERNGTFWTIFGFTIGLTVTAAAVFWFIRRRLQGGSLENQSFQIAQNGHLSNGSGRPQTTPGQATPAKSQQNQAPATQPQAVQPAVAIAEPVSEIDAQAKPETATPAPELQHTPTPVVTGQVNVSVTPAAEETPTPTGAERPLDATFIGVVSTKRYYPVETPLDQLQEGQEEPLNVIYFASEDEAKEQGFSAAEEA